MLKDTQSYPTGLGMLVGLAQAECAKKEVNSADDGVLCLPDSSSSCENGYATDHDCLDDVTGWENMWCEDPASSSPEASQ